MATLTSRVFRTFSEYRTEQSSDVCVVERFSIDRALHGRTSRQSVFNGSTTERDRRSRQRLGPV